ncbi:hypothetical protein LDENG_00100880 [Lucifuga dentata]|nr:hypothetical protein LDENG_00100880 [Lucifuga dentata]
MYNFIAQTLITLHAIPNMSSPLKGLYRPFCMFEPNIFNFHTCYVTDKHFPKDKTVFQLSCYFAKSLNLSKSNIQVIHPP